MVGEGVEHRARAAGWGSCVSWAYPHSTHDNDSDRGSGGLPSSIPAGFQSWLPSFWPMCRCRPAWEVAEAAPTRPTMTESFMLVL